MKTKEQIKEEIKKIDSELWKQKPMSILTQWLTISKQTLQWVLDEREKIL